MYNDYASFSSPYNIVIQIIIITTEHTQITREVTLLGKTHKIVTSGFSKIDTPGFSKFQA
jgi:hypothetical protein